jgi:hypothetical protein
MVWTTSGADKRPLFVVENVASLLVTRDYIPADSSYEIRCAEYLVGNGTYSRIKYDTPVRMKCSPTSSCTTHRSPHIVRFGGSPILTPRPETGEATAVWRNGYPALGMGRSKCEAPSATSTKG